MDWSQSFKSGASWSGSGGKAAMMMVAPEDLTMDTTGWAVSCECRKSARQARACLSRSDWTPFCSDMTDPSKKGRGWARRASSNEHIYTSRRESYKGTFLVSQADARSDHGKDWRFR